MSQISKETSANYQIGYTNSWQPSFSPFAINPFERQRKRTKISRSQVLPATKVYFPRRWYFPRVALKFMRTNGLTA